ncbi:MAG: alpha/beta hydrolase [Elusimicrobiota bacterium]|nr:alpha/beta hydrolase [Elusimicrobiota bacterium]
MRNLLALLFASVLLPCALNAAENITINTEDGWELSALYEPSENGRYVILLHDLGKNKDEFNKLENKIKGAGYGFFAVDLRGHGASLNKGDYRNFAKTGTDNEFNQMVRDVTAAIGYLNKKDIPTQDIYLAGSGLGANVAAKSLIFNPDIAGIALFTPSLKTRDVLTMNGIKINTKPVFIAVSSEDRKQMMEASFIRNAAFLSSGEGRVTFMTAYNLRGAEMADKWLGEEFLQWLAAPQRPPVLPDGEQEITPEVPAAPQF